MKRLVLVALLMLGAAQAAEVRQIPLQPGLVMVSALHWEAGDREPRT